MTGSLSLSVKSHLTEVCVTLDIFPCCTFLGYGTLVLCSILVKPKESDFSNLNSSPLNGGGFLMMISINRCYAVQNSFIFKVDFRYHYLLYCCFVLCIPPVLYSAALQNCHEKSTNSATLSLHRDDGKMNILLAGTTTTTIFPVKNAVAD